MHGQQNIKIRNIIYINFMLEEVFIFMFIFVFMCIRGVTGGTDQTSGGCSLCYTIPI